MENELSQEIVVLEEISSAIVKERDVRKLLNKVLDILEKRMGMLRGTFTLLEGDELSIEASRGLGADEIARGHYKLGEGITGMVANQATAEIVPDIHKDKRFLNRTHARKDSGPVAFICVPLIHLGRVIGTLSIDRANPKNETEIFKRDVALLRIIANLTADAAGICLKEREEREKLEKENRRLRTMLSEDASGGIIGNCRQMRAVYEQIRLVAPSNATVLIRGASGTGKELVARAIQKRSNRSKAPFIILNCAALPEALLESELFGHERGAFTDARERRIGRAEAANGGTLFLDEIGDLSLPLQVKLLRFLQERTFSRVGSNEELKSDVRFIAATSRNLEEMMREGKFREDLYYRLSVFPITVPELKNRGGDILMLAEHFLGRMSLKYGKNVTKISPPAVNALLAWSWPGNVRELENSIERAVLTATDDTIHGYNLPPQIAGENAFTSPETLAPASGKKLSELLEDYERKILEDALRRHNGNQSAVGRELGVSPRMMTYRLAKLRSCNETT